MNTTVSKTTAEESQVNSSPKLDKKFKATIYLTEEAEQAFAELFVKRYMKNRKIDRSAIACEAILALHAKEKEDGLGK